MIDVIAEVTPLTIDWKVLVVVAITLDVMIDEVATVPLTLDVKVLEAADRLLVTDRPSNEVVATTPLMVVVRVPPE
jgi:hypothetical protein